MLVLQLGELVFEVLDVLLFALPECALRGSILGAAALQVGGQLSPGVEIIGVLAGTYDGHVRNRLLVLSGL